MWKRWYFFISIIVFSWWKTAKLFCVFWLFYAKCLFKVKLIFSINLSDKNQSFFFPGLLATNPEAFWLAVALCDHGWLLNLLSTQSCANCASLKNAKTSCLMKQKMSEVIMSSISIQVFKMSVRLSELLQLGWCAPARLLLPGLKAVNTVRLISALMCI